MPKQPITRKWTEEDVSRLLQLIEEGATLMRAAAACKADRPIKFQPIARDELHASLRPNSVRPHSSKMTMGFFSHLDRPGARLPLVNVLQQFSICCHLLVCRLMSEAIEQITIGTQMLIRETGSMKSGAFLGGAVSRIRGAGPAPPRDCPRRLFRLLPMAEVVLQ